MGYKLRKGHEEELAGLEMRNEQVVASMLMGMIGVLGMGVISRVTCGEYSMGNE